MGGGPFTLSELGHESCTLAADGSEDCPLAKRARNSLPPMIDAAIKHAWALNEAIERADMASRKK